MAEMGKFVGPETIFLNFKSDMHNFQRPFFLGMLLKSCQSGAPVFEIFATHTYQNKIWVLPPHPVQNSSAQVCTFQQ